MSTLEDQLADLAEAAPRAVPDPGLYDRARRFHRRRRAGTALVAAVALLVVGALTGLSWQSGRPEAGPAVAPSGAAVPDRLFAPSGWLSGTDADGPLGRLAAVVPAQRHHWSGSEPGYAGVSAATGTYRFLDLPGAVADAPFPQLTAGDAVSLSPDGEHVAYWTTGPRTGTAPVGVTRTVGGVAVYDTGTGEVRRHAIPSAHGLWGESLAWSDADTLVVFTSVSLGGAGDPESDQTAARQQDVLVWRMDQPQPQTLAGTDVLSLWGAAGEGTVPVGVAARSFGLLDPRAGSPVRVVRLDQRLGTGPAVDPTGTRIAAVRSRNGGGAPDSVVVGDLRDGRRVDLRVLPGSERTLQVLGWTDATHLLAVRSVPSPRSGDPRDLVAAVVSMDSGTGASRTLVELAPSGGAQVSTDLLARPTVPAVEPPHPWDPRLVTALAVVTLLVAAAVAVRRRIRVRP